MKEGTVVNINKQEGVICSIDEIDGIKYVNVAFDNNIYNIYRLEKDNGEDYLVLETNKEIVGNLLSKYLNDYLKENA